MRRKGDVGGDREGVGGGGSVGVSVCVCEGDKGYGNDSEAESSYDDRERADQIIRSHFSERTNTNARKISGENDTDLMQGNDLTEEFVLIL